MEEDRKEELKRSFLDYINTWIESEFMDVDKNIYWIRENDVRIDEWEEIKKEMDLKVIDNSKELDEDLQIVKKAYDYFTKRCHKKDHSVCYLAGLLGYYLERFE